MLILGRRAATYTCTYDMHWVTQNAEVMEQKSH
jgi:hypothetical protein